MDFHGPSILGISRRTLYSYRQEQVGEGDPYALPNLTDENLDLTLQDYIGIRLVHGALRARGIRVPQYRVRECLHRVDPTLRWACPVSRRTYCVPGANFLWHMDGNHKLIR